MRSRLRIWLSAPNRTMMRMRGRVRNRISLLPRLTTPPRWRVRGDVPPVARHGSVAQPFQASRKGPPARRDPFPIAAGAGPALYKASGLYRLSTSQIACIIPSHGERAADLLRARGGHDPLPHTPGAPQDGGEGRSPDPPDQPAVADRVDRAADHDAED